jgi:GDP-mannose transporter
LKQVLSSLIAAWDDVARLLSNSGSGAALLSDAEAAQSARTAAGYAWMMVNCLASAGYVLGMRKRIKVTNFKVSLFTITK